MKNWGVFPTEVLGTEGSASWDSQTGAEMSLERLWNDMISSRNTKMYLPRTNLVGVFGCFWCPEDFWGVEKKVYSPCLGLERYGKTHQNISFSLESTSKKQLSHRKQPHLCFGCDGVESIAMAWGEWPLFVTAVWTHQQWGKPSTFGSQGAPNIYHICKKMITYMII